jgi:hypothetical protein
MLTPFRGSAGIILAALSLASAAAQPGAVNAVTPVSHGVLTKCFDWVMTSSCRTYHHITLPSRIAVGNTIPLAFGSATKRYGFVVARIVLNGNQCKILSREDRDHRRDKIEVTPCYSTSGQR